jgi:hypothetical protein
MNVEEAALEDGWIEAEVLLKSILPRCPWRCTDQNSVDINEKEVSREAEPFGPVGIGLWCNAGRLRVWHWSGEDALRAE